MNIVWLIYLIQLHVLKVHGIYEIMAKKGIAPRKQVYATSLQYIVKGLEKKSHFHQAF